MSSELPPSKNLQKSFVLVLRRGYLQITRKQLECEGYANSSLRMRLLGEDKAAIPVTEECVQRITRHKPPESDNDESNISGLYHAVYRYAGVDVQVDYMDMQLSKKALTPYQLMESNIKTLVLSSGLQGDIGVLWERDLRADLPKSWEKHGDLILLSDKCFLHHVWNQLPGLWECVAASLCGARVARKAVVSADGFRSPQVQMLLGSDGWVTHVDNGIKYSYDVTRCMFSAGNVTEKLRVAGFDCAGQVVVDMYAGIGYFTLAYLSHTEASHVHACEWSPHAVAALTRNLQLNGVQDRCTVHPGDNRKLSLRSVADRVNLGLIPSSEAGWAVACRVLRGDTGGMLHVHANVSSHTQHNVSSHTQHNVSSHTQHNVSSHTQHNVSSHTQHNVSSHTQHNVSSHPQHVSSHREAGHTVGDARHKHINGDSVSTVYEGDNVLTPDVETCNGEKLGCNHTSSEPASSQESQEVCHRTNTKGGMFSDLNLYGRKETQTQHGSDTSSTLETETGLDISRTVDISAREPDLNKPQTPLAKDQYCSKCKQKTVEIIKNQDNIQQDTIINKCSKLKTKNKKSVRFAKRTSVHPAWEQWAVGCGLTMGGLLGEAHGGAWHVTVVHIEHVKSYAPHIDHIVVDMKCTPCCK